MGLSFRLGQYMTLFQAKLYAIKACTMEIIYKGHKIRIICILPYIQRLKHLDNYRINRFQKYVIMAY
jgi:hypothetical protein